MGDLDDLRVLVRSAVPILVIETHEERRTVELFQALGPEVTGMLFRWSATEGLRRLAPGYAAQGHTRTPVEMLAQVKAATRPATYLLADFHPYLGEPLHVRYLRDIALGYPEVARCVVLISHHIEVPAELDHLCARFTLSLPGRDRIEALVGEEARRWAGAQHRPVRVEAGALGRLVDNLVGLPQADVRRLARRAIADDGALSAADVPEVTRAKFDLLARGGVLSFEHDCARFTEVGGLDRLRAWLELRHAVFAGELDEPGLDPPRGILLLGVQGCGKSLAAKAVAGSWALALLRLDFGALYNKYHGETERNLRDSLRQAEVMAPCVLWMDEIEKGVGTEAGDSGTSRRVLGTLLTWMAENRARVFIVATANDIEAMPPELLRKGRLDEIFFVDLPDEGVRREILAIHLRGRGIDPQGLDLAGLAIACEGFSGAEIEQAVVSARYAALARKGPVDTALVREQIHATRPLSVLMAERIAALRAWAAGRTVAA